jgi:hypothetical protein
MTNTPEPLALECALRYNRGESVTSIAGSIGVSEDDVYGALRRANDYANRHKAIKNAFADGLLQSMEDAIRVGFRTETESEPLLSMLRKDRQAAQAASESSE